MSDIEVTMISGLIPVRIVNGIPQCHCCQEPMVVVKPGKWMCAVGVAMAKLLEANIPQKGFLEQHAHTERLA